MANKIRKAVFPAAGLGTRFLPATKASPKEMLPLVDKPLIQYAVEEAVASGIESILIITGRDKTAIENHFDISFELEELLKKKGKTEMFDEVRARQREMRGHGGTRRAGSHVERAYIVDGKRIGRHDGVSVSTQRLERGVDWTGP